ncbi:MAG: ATP-binding protein [Myxococcales bacterium]|nr:ATP-binding protein [Myxococcales bacterium]
MGTPYLHRELTSSIEAALESMPVVVVTGMRQVGKTTLLVRDPVLGKRRYRTLDDFPMLEAARRDPEAFLDGDEPLTIDEAQKCPELLTAIKRRVDRDRRPGRFLLSGSANFALLRGISESLAGRAVYLVLAPLTRRELARTLDQVPFLIRFARELALQRAAPTRPVPVDEILRGGMPAVRIDGVRDPSLWFRGYEQTYLERDLRALAQVGDLVAFRRVLVLAALRTAQVLPVSGLARDAQLSVITAGRYLGLLETSYVIRRIPPFLGNRASRLIKSPKIYLTDSGLAAHLAGVTDLSVTAEEPLRGPLFETWVLQQLAGLLESHWAAARLGFWHVQGRHEVDFVIEAGRDTIAIEVKAAGRWTERDLVGLRAFLAATPRCRAAILAYNGSDAVSLGNKLWAIPLDLLLS